MNDLRGRGCKAIIYVEYVPVGDDSQNVAPQDEDREYLDERLHSLRMKHEDMLFVSFPEDEKSSGGCLAAGLGFFHINTHGGAEPCPFPSYSNVNVEEASLQEALQSRLLMALRSGEMLTGEHLGGCVLFEQRAEVEAILNQEVTVNG